MCLTGGPREASTHLGFERKAWCLNLQGLKKNDNRANSVTIYLFFLLYFLLLK